MAKTINDEFMQQVVTEQAWKVLAEKYAWTEVLLEKCSDKLDWKLISTNRVIQWTIPMLTFFATHNQMWSPQDIRRSLLMEASMALLMQERDIKEYYNIF